MGIKANIKLDTAREILERRWDNQLNCFLGDTIVVHPDEEPLLQMILSRHALNVRHNEKIEIGGAFLETVPEWLMGAVIEWEA